MAVVSQDRFHCTTMNGFTSPSQQRPGDLSNVATISWQIWWPYYRGIPGVGFEH